jgi:hypothetical protein
LVINAPDICPACCRAVPAHGSGHDPRPQPGMTVFSKLLVGSNLLCLPEKVATQNVTAYLHDVLFQTGRENVNNWLVMLQNFKISYIYVNLYVDFN